MSQKFVKPRCTPTTRRVGETLEGLVRGAGKHWSVGQMLEVLSWEFRTLGRSLAWLAAYEDDAELRARAAVLLVEGLEDRGVSPRVREKVGEQAVELAERVLRDPKLADARKLALHSVLIRAGRELGEDELAECFEDFAGCVEAGMREVVSTMVDTVEQVEVWLEGTEAAAAADGAESEYEVAARCLSVATVVAEGNGRVGATALVVSALLALELEPEVAEDLGGALELAARSDPPRALALLSEVGTWPSSGALGAKARELSLRLRAEGVRPLALAAPEIAHAWVSPIDANGSRALQLQLRRDDGEMDALTLVFNDGLGLLDVWCAFGAGAEIGARFAEEGIVMEACDAGFARELVADALAVSEDAGEALPGRWLLYRGCFPGALEPAARAPRLDAYGLEGLPRDATLARGTEVLEASLAYGELGFDSDAAYAFVQERMGEGGLELDRAVVSAFLQVVESHERERLTGRLAVNLEHEARAGRAADPVNQLAARAWVVLSEGLVPFTELPYARALAGSAVELIARNLVLGYERQEDASQAALRGDEELDAALLVPSGDLGL